MASALDNGASPLPPLGWSTWNPLGGNIDEATIRKQADAMVSSGMKAAGYSYINIDDLWARHRAQAPPPCDSSQFASTCSSARRCLER